MRWLARFITRRVLRHDGEVCQRCGWAVAWGCPTYWTAPDALWQAVEGSEGGIRCIRCFTRDCSERGIQICWQARYVAIAPSSEVDR